MDLIKRIQELENLINKRFIQSNIIIKIIDDIEPNKGQIIIWKDNNIDRIWVDDKEEYDKIVNFVSQTNNSKKITVELRENDETIDIIESQMDYFENYKKKFKEIEEGIKNIDKIFKGIENQKDQNVHSKKFKQERKYF